MSSYQDAATATVRIECAESIGSGFHFLRPDIVVTNWHVVAVCLSIEKGPTAMIENAPSRSRLGF